MILHNNTMNQPNSSVIKNNSYIMNQAATTMFGFANSEDEAKLMNISRGFNSAYIFDLNQNRFYFKQIDSNGQVIRFDIYEYNQIIPPEPEKPVSHEDLANLKTDIISQIAAILQTQQTSKEDDVVG